MHKGTIRSLEEKDISNVEGIYDLYWADAFREKLSRKIKEFISKSKKALEEKVNYFVIEDEGKILGAISFRTCPHLMMEYSKTPNPLEIYILAVVNQGKGVGKALVEKALEEGKSQGYTEALLYNSDLHQESRGFYLHSGFEDAGVATAPDGELGHVFRMDLKKFQLRTTPAANKS